MIGVRSQNLNVIEKVVRLQGERYAKATAPNGSLATAMSRGQATQPRASRMLVGWSVKVQGKAHTRGLHKSRRASYWLLVVSSEEGVISAVSVQ